MKTLFYFPVPVLLLLSVATVTYSKTDHGHDHKAHEQTIKQDQHTEHEIGNNHEEHEEGVIKLSSAQQQTAGIIVESLHKRELASETRAPGEVKLNA